MVRYIILSSLIWGISSLFYAVFLRNEKHFDYNRIFLLSTILLGLIVPAIPNLNLFHNESILSIGTSLNISLPELTITTTAKKYTNTTQSNIHISVLILYLTGCIIVAINLIKSLIALDHYRNIGKTVYSNGYRLVILEESLVAFSFMNTIFISSNIYRSSKKNEILTHEIVHINQRHSYDILSIEIIKILFWFNPFVYLYRLFLTETHEYIADSYVIKKISKKNYGELLINQLQSGVQYKIANYFINSLIKNRIKMMYKAKSKRKWKYFLAFPMLITLILLINSCESNVDGNQKDDLAQVASPPPPPTSKVGDEVTYKITVVDKEATKSTNVNNTTQDSNLGEIYQIVEEMPRFPGCEDTEAKEEMMNCSNMKLYKYLYGKIVYPKKAKDEKIQGKVIARFVVDKKGNIKNIKILRDIGGGCGDEVIRVLESMNHMPEKWIPGKQNGENVNVYFTLPVIFKL